MTRSLRVRLLVGTSVAMTVVLVLLSVGIYLTVRRALLAEFDTGLRAKAQALIGITEQHGDKLDFEFDPLQMPEFSRARHEYFELWQEDGRVLARSPSLGANGSLGQQKPSDGLGALILPDDRRGRSLAVTFRPSLEPDASPTATTPPRNRVTVVVARATTSLDSTFSRLGYWLVGFCGVAIAVSGGVLILVVRQSLAPVSRLSTRIQEIGETDLSRRLDPEDVPLELAPVVVCLNGLLERLDDAFSRERAFTGDVAHELRTPLAGLQATLEVCRSKPRDPGDYEAAIDRCRSILSQTSAMVESLLLLARADAGQLVVDKRRSDLRVLLEECWESSFADRARLRGLDVQWRLPDACFFETDEDKLRIVIRNLFDNAVVYTNAGGAIRIEMESRQESFIFEIINSGSGLSVNEVRNVFDRFWRGDESRHDLGEHGGIGLSICRRLIDLLGGKIEAESRPGGVFAVRIELPGSCSPSQELASESIADCLAVWDRPQ